jgi:hypothetical protein
VQHTRGSTRWMCTVLLDDALADTDHFLNSKQQ